MPHPSRPSADFPRRCAVLEDALETTKWWIQESSPYAIKGLYHLLWETLVTLNRVFRFGGSPPRRPEWTEDNAAVEGDDGEEAVVQDVKLEKRYSTKTAATINLLDEPQIPYDLIIRLLERICFEDDLLVQHSAAILIFMPGMGEIRRLNDMLTEHKRFRSEDEFSSTFFTPVSSENQGAVFDVPRRGVRKIVIRMCLFQHHSSGILIPSESDEHCGNWDHHSRHHLRH